MHRLSALMMGAGVLFLMASAQVRTAPPAAKAKKLYCPVAGIPEPGRRDNCPNGYCARKVRPTLTAEYQGGKVSFCCGGCAREFKKSPKTFAAAANLQLAATGQAKQVACPFSGKELKKTKGALTNVAGVNVSACCETCQKKLSAMKQKQQLDVVFGAKGFKKAFEVKK